MGIVPIVNCTVIYIAGVGSKIVLRTRPEVARLVSQVSGGAMIVIAVLLLLEQAFALR